MKPDEIKKIIGEHLEKPESYIGNYQELVEVISEEEKNLSEADIHSAIRECNFRSPENIALVALVCPPLVVDISERIFTGKIMQGIYRWTLYFWYSLMVINLVTGHMTRSDVVLFGICLLVTSICFRGWAKQWNSMELIYQVLKTQGKVP